MVERSSVKLWIFFDGPHHLKTLEPVRAIMAEQVQEVFAGVECMWPINVHCNYKNEFREYTPGLCQIAACVGCICSDQPAAVLLNGHATHAALKGCRCGCIGDTVNHRQGLVGKGQSKVRL